MRNPFCTRESQIEEALKECVHKLRHTAAGRWDFEVINGRSHTVAVRLDESWLLLDSPLGGAGWTDHWNLLRLNRALGPGCKVVLVSGKQAIRLRADIPLDTDIDLSGRLSEVCVGFRTALRLVHGEEKRCRDRASADSASALSTDVIRLCDEAGWSSTQRPGGQTIVDLDVRRGLYQAAIDRQEDAVYGFRVSVAVARQESFSDSSRRALSRLLLRAGGLVRLARAAVEETEVETRLVFESRLGAAPCASELHHALSALSVACLISGEEAKAVQDESTAARYLAVSA